MARPPAQVQAGAGDVGLLPRLVGRARGPLRVLVHHTLVAADRDQFLDQSASRNADAAADVDHRARQVRGGRGGEHSGGDVPRVDKGPDGFHRPPPPPPPPTHRPPPPPAPPPPPPTPPP